jgi:PGF-pre-PGF domain-containing protein
MNIKSISLIIATLLLFSLPTTFAASPYFFKGYAFVNSGLAPNGTIVQAFLNGASTAANTVTVGEGVLANTREGWYTISFEASAGDTVIFKLNGVALNGANGTNNATQTLVAGGIVTENFNLSINKSADGVACTYASGCSGGYCLHSYCRSSSTYCGDGYCDSGESCSSDNSACSSGYACTNGCVATGGGGGGGGGTVTVETSQSFTTVTPTAPASISVPESKVDDLKVENVEIEVKETVKNMEVTIKEASKPSGANLAISTDIGATYAYLSITTNIDNAKINKATVKFVVEKSWVTKNSIDVSTIALNRYASNAWNKLPTTKTSEDATYYYFEAETPGFSTFAVTGQKKSDFWTIIDKINLYYSGGDVTFWDIINLINSYYNK